MLFSNSFRPLRSAAAIVCTPHRPFICVKRVEVYDNELAFKNKSIDYFKPNEIRIRITGDDALDVEGTSGRDAHTIRLAERLLCETQLLDQ